VQGSKVKFERKNFRASQVSVSGEIAFSCGGKNTLKKGFRAVSALRPKRLGETILSEEMG
jgi:hypothetical protein